MMMIRRRWFNIYLLLVVASGWGCETEKSRERNQISTLRVHVEANADGSDRSKQVQVYRASPFAINIDKSPFITEANITEATLVDELDSFALRVKLDGQGSRLLEQYSTANRGRRFAIFSQFEGDPDGKHPEARWLAAPKMTRRISDGMLTFTPDATKAETRQIALGLNNAARKGGRAPNSPRLP